MSHPLLDVNNGIAFRFLPGVVIGVLLHRWVSGSRAAGESSESESHLSKGSTRSNFSGLFFRPPASSMPAPAEEYKMVLCVNQELKMTKGKVAAQCCHAAVAVVQDFGKRMPSWFRAWEQGGQAKIALRVDSTNKLQELAKQAQSAKLPFYVVADAGRTQIAAGSQTVVAIGPAPVSRINQITGRLPLL